MDAHFAVSLQSQYLRDTAARRKHGSDQQWQKGDGVALTNSSNMVVANNLASLMSAHSISRAACAEWMFRRSKSYARIEYRRGNPAEALASLEPAARGLPNDPLVHYHLGMTYVALNRPADARATLELAGDSPLPQFAEARKTLETLPAGE